MTLHAEFYWKSFTITLPRSNGDPEIGLVIGDFYTLLFFVPCPCFSVLLRPPRSSSLLHPPLAPPLTHPHSCLIPSVFAGFQQFKLIEKSFLTSLSHSDRLCKQLQSLDQLELCCRNSLRLLLRRGMLRFPPALLTAACGISFKQTCTSSYLFRLARPTGVRCWKIKTSLLHFQSLWSPLLRS